MTYGSVSSFFNRNIVHMLDIGEDYVIWEFFYFIFEKL